MEECTALVEFSYVKEVKINFDEDTDNPDDIVRNILEQESSELHDDYESADFVNVSYKYADGSMSDWSEL